MQDLMRKPTGKLVHLVRILERQSNQLSEGKKSLLRPVYKSSSKPTYYFNHVNL
jgi:hypothetical protein